MDETGIQPTLASLMPDDLDPGNIVVTYDGDSDTLLVHFYGRGIPGVSVEAGDDAMIRLDSDRQRVIGIHIEHFLRLFAPKHPDFLDVLDLAELRAISVEDLAKVRREIKTQHKDAVLKRIMGELQLLATAAD